MKKNLVKRRWPLAGAVVLAVLFPQAALAVQVDNFDRFVVAGDSVFVAISENGGNFSTGRGQIVSVTSSGVRIRATLINGGANSTVTIAGLTASGGLIANCVVTVLGPIPKPAKEALCPTTAVRYRVSVSNGGL